MGLAMASLNNTCLRCGKSMGYTNMAYCLGCWDKSNKHLSLKVQIQKIIDLHYPMASSQNSNPYNKLVRDLEAFINEKLGH